MIEIIEYNSFNLEEYQSNKKNYNKNVETYVKEIVDKIRYEKDKALFEYAFKFDRIDFNKIPIKVSQKEIEKAYNRLKNINPSLIESLKVSIDRISSFHKHQKEKNFFVNEANTFIGQLIIPLNSVLTYIPGGKALYPSSLIMNVIPAQIAGVKNIYVTTPANANGDIDDKILATAYLLGIKDIYKIGGAHAIAAFAFGTESIPRVDKITGPGNIYVATAKKIVYGEVDIDMVAGPTEVLIIADNSVNPYNIALDMLAQAEHDEMASSILITTSSQLAEEVKKEISLILNKNKNVIAEKSISRNGKIIIVNNVEEAFKIANRIAPEHLELMIKEPFKYLNYIENAGAIFLGEYTPESAGDYIAGPNHTLPTMGTARFYSQLGVYDFVKRSGVVYFTREKLDELKKYISEIAEAENLFFHSMAAKDRK